MDGGDGDKRNANNLNGSHSMNVIDAALPIVGYSFLPAAAGTGGGVIAAFRPPGAKLRSMIQHFAAGVVFSVAAVELLPDIVRRHLAWEVGVEFAAGVGAMLILKGFGARLEKTAARRTGGSPFLVAIGIDVLIDGLLLGIGFTTGAREGFLLTLALTTELTSLGLALAVEMQASGSRRAATVRRIALVSTLLPVGALIGSVALRFVSPPAMEIALAFGLAALLYLVTEELLVEAHAEPETPVTTAVFFGGFLLFLLIGMAS